jgi:LmbE family N-acetylglucosaminyl deacetylase
MTHLEPEGWETPQKILVILAHPDDPEFFCGGSIKRWTAAGHQVVYWLITCGDKGTPDRSISSDELCAIRHREQSAAASALGVQAVHFLEYPDGYLVANLNLRRDLTRVIRMERPDVLVTCDPKTLYTMDHRLNHPDHRAAGQAALDAVFPAARDYLYFPELLTNEGLEPHVVREVWVCGTLEPTHRLDVTEYWETKIQALYNHKSQIGDPQALAQRMRLRRTKDSSDDQPRYEENFHRLLLG